VHWLEELARTTTSFKLAGKTELPLIRTNSHVENYLDSREGHFKILIRQYSLMVVFKVLITAALLLIGGILVMNQELNLGQFVAAEIIILLVMSSVEKLILCLETIYDVLTSLEKIGQVTDMELEPNTGVSISETECGLGMEIEMQDVCFRYPGETNNVLNHLNLVVKGGETVMLAGKNGSGKSTLLQVMAGLYDPCDGNMIYQGLPKGNLDLNSVRKVIGDCLSQEQLFQGTILENITIGRKAATLENVRWATTNVGLDEYIKSLPEGYNTFLDPQGKRLPASIIQRILLARSIADRPKLLILEDAFEHIDVGDSKKIMSFLMQPENNWTMVIVSTSHSLNLETDRVAWLEEGSIHKIGSYTEMKKWIKSNTNGYA
jgi:ABC-type bacteriocin/lantibiotic exporter with double-glycine peptidase domain